MYEKCDIIKKNTVVTIERKYYYTGDSLLFVSDPANNKTIQNILDLSGNILMSERYEVSESNNITSGWFTFNTDIRGSTTNILDSSGYTVTGYVYDEFGNQIKTGEEDFLNEASYTGAIYDEEIGLYYMNARYYDSTTGQFISRDTYLGDAYNPWTQNLYTYTGNNPVNYVDPTGHFVNTILGGVVGAVFGGVSAMITGGDIGTGIISGFASGSIMGAGVDISLATGGVAAVAIAGALGGATGELLNQVGNGQDLDIVKVLVKSAAGAGSNFIGYGLTCAGSAISAGTKIGWGKMIGALTEWEQWVTTGFISYVSNVYTSILDVGANMLGDSISAWMRDTIEFVERSSQKYQAIYDSVDIQTNGPSYGNYKWL